MFNPMLNKITIIFLSIIFLTNLSKAEQDNEVIQNFSAELKQELRDRPWILREISQNSKIQQRPFVKETFTFYLGESSEAIFKWNPSKNKNLLFEVFISFMDSVGNIGFPDGQKNQYVEIFSKSKQSGLFYFLTRVYEHKILEINFESDFRIFRFHNNYRSQIVVQVNIQAIEMLMETGIQDDSLQQSRNKMNDLLSSIKQQMHEDEKEHLLESNRLSIVGHHYEIMLIIAGIELAIIIGIGCMQIICIRKLLDNYSVI